MICSIQSFLIVKCNRNITLIDKRGCIFRSLNSTLNFQMKEKAGQGIGIAVNQANFIPEEQEKNFGGKLVLRQRQRGATLLYFGVGFWHSVCCEGWAGTQEFEIPKLAVVVAT